MLEDNLDITDKMSKKQIDLLRMVSGLPFSLDDETEEDEDEDEE